MWVVLKRAGCCVVVSGGYVNCTCVLQLFNSLLTPCFVKVLTKSHMHSVHMCDLVNTFKTTRAWSYWSQVRFGADIIYVALFVVRDDEEDEPNVQQTSAQPDTSTLQSSASVQPAEIFAADSSTVSLWHFLRDVRVLVMNKLSVAFCCHLSLVFSFRLTERCLLYRSLIESSTKY